MKIASTDPRGPVPESDFKRNPLQHIRYLYLAFVQGIFSFSPRGAYHWDKDMENSDIVITAESPLNPETVGQRPGITFTRAPVGFFQLGFDDMLAYDFATGQKQKSMLVPGTMVINCCSRNDIESEHIAWVTAEHLWLLRDLMMKAGFYDVGRNLQISSPSPAGKIVANDQGDEWFCTTITSPFHFYRTSAFTPLNQNVVQEIGLRLTAQPPRVLGTKVPDPMPGGADLPYEQVNRFPAPALPQQSTTLPKVPHPLNPAQLVTVKVVSGGLRPPSINGRPLPILRSNVGDSKPSTGVTVNVKV